MIATTVLVLLGLTLIAAALVCVTLKFTLLKHRVRLTTAAAILMTTAGEPKLYEPPHGETNNLHMRNNDADQLRSNCEADQRLYFRYTDSTISLLLKSEISSL